jgi:hypothetical protein
MSSDALSRRSVGRYRVDIRLCRGRKGLPHVAYEDMTGAETELVRQRLLTSVRAAIQEGIINEADLELLASTTASPPDQIPMSIVMPAATAAG